MTVKLFTRDGGLVTEAEIPPFNIPPDVMIWGARFFVVPDVDSPVARLAHEAPEGVLTYTEAFTYAIPVTA